MKWYYDKKTEKYVVSDFVISWLLNPIQNIQLIFSKRKKEEFEQRFQEVHIR